MKATYYRHGMKFDRDGDTLAESRERWDDHESSEGMDIVQVAVNAQSDATCESGSAVQTDVLFLPRGGIETVAAKVRALCESFASDAGGDPRFDYTVYKSIDESRATIDQQRRVWDGSHETDGGDMVRIEIGMPNKRDGQSWEDISIYTVKGERGTVEAVDAAIVRALEGDSPKPHYDERDMMLAELIHYLYEKCDADLRTALKEAREARDDADEPRFNQSTMIDYNRLTSDEFDLIRLYRLLNPDMQYRVVKCAEDLNGGWDTSDAFTLSKAEVEVIEALREQRGSAEMVKLILANSAGDDVDERAQEFIDRATDAKRNARRAGMMVELLAYMEQESDDAIADKLETYREAREANREHAERRKSAQVATSDDDDDDAGTDEFGNPEMVAVSVDLFGLVPDRGECDDSATTYRDELRQFLIPSERWDELTKALSATCQRFASEAMVTA
ncbi:MAG: hypothetical protein AB7N71_04125 [Phycisphaerae bacterium]